MRLQVVYTSQWKMERERENLAKPIICIGSNIDAVAVILNRNARQLCNATQIALANRRQQYSRSFFGWC